MRKIYKFALTLILVSVLAVSASAQRVFFSDANATEAASGLAKRSYNPERYRISSLNLLALRSFLWSVPNERSLANRAAAPVLELPMPDGNTGRFRIWESSVMEPGLAAKYPEMKTFAGQGIDDPYATIRFDYNPYFGFSAQVLSPNGRVYIDPLANGDASHIISYYHRDNKRSHHFHCETPEDQLPVMEAPRIDAACRGTQLYTYRIAVACTGEYARAATGLANPSVAQALARIVTTINRVTQVYEQDLAIRLTLIANNDIIVFTDPATDPFNGNNNAGTLINESQNVIGNNIGAANYDIGHTFSTGGGGLAGLRVVCTDATKARGITGSSQPTGDGYDIDYVAHEVGHQFGGNHTFNGSGGSCGGNRNSSTAYEVGSGSSIQAYAGICSGDNIQPNSDPFFHAISFDEISNFVEAGGSSCRVATPTGNNLPVITSMGTASLNIPLGTPFTLTGTAVDADNDALTYSWEQWDLGPQGTWNSGANNTTSPLFRSRVPKTTGSRTFPDMRIILAGYPANPPSSMDGLKGETLPNVARTMKFRLTVRDNRAGGGGSVSGGNGGCQADVSGVFQVNTIAGTGPFVVTSPNGGESYPGGSVQNVTWNVAGTNAAPISCANVKISMSTDGGLTYPTVLVASTPNDGSELVGIPVGLTTTARIRIEAVDNVFFDISNANFSVTAPVSGFGFDSPAATNVTCGTQPSAQATLAVLSFSGYTTPVNLTAENVPAGTTVTFGTNPVTPGGTTVVTLNGTNNLPFGTHSITIRGISGVYNQTRQLDFVIPPGVAPAIGTQPLPQTACVGTNASFTAAAPGATGYQWQVSTNGGASFTDVASGGNSATYTINGVTAGLNNNQYRVIISGQCFNVTSNAVALTVQNAPAITTHPQSSTTCENSNAQFSVAATGTSLSYLWQVSTDNGATYNPAPGANTAATYTAANVTTGMNGNRYRVVVSGGCTPAATSSAATLTVISPVVVTNQPDAAVLCQTFNTSFTVAGTGAGVIYQWQVSTDGGNTFTNLTNNATYTGVNTATLELTTVPADFNNNQYRALLSNPTCLAPTASDAALLTVNVRPTITLSAAPTSTLLPGQTSTLTATITPSAPGFNISWYRDGALIPGATAPTYVVDSVEVGSYMARIDNPATGCNNESQAINIITTASERLFIFPSPNNGQFTVSYYNSAGANTRQSVTVYDSRGARVFHNNFTVNGPYQLMNINIKGHTAGVYYVVVGDASGKKLADGKVMVTQ